VSTSRWFPPLLGVAILVAATVFGSRPLISYAALDLGASTFEIGAIAASFAISAIAAAMPVGRLVDERGERVVIAIGSVVIAIGCLVAWMAGSLVQLALAQVALGLGQLMVVVGSHAVLAVRGDQAGRDRLIGFYAAAVSLGYTVGPGMAGILADPRTSPLGQEAFFLLGAGAALMAAALTARLPHGPADAPVEGTGVRSRTSVRELLGLPLMRQALVGSVAALATIDLLLTYLPVLGSERGWQPALVGTMLAALGLSQMLARLFLGRLAARFEHVRLLRSSLALPAILIPLLLLFDVPVALVACMAGAGLALGSAQPMTLSLVAEAAPPGSKGLAMSLRLTGNRIAQLVIPIVFGAAAGITGVGGIFVATGGILGASWSYLGRRRQGTGGSSSDP
jgi:MFS family permease